MGVPSADVVVIGGGAIGTSTLYHLARAGCTNAVLLERDTVACGSTSAAAGGFRAQFSDELNIRIALSSIERFARFADEIGTDIDFRQPGYEISPDHNAVVGAAGDPRGFLYATGFSGHGFQQSPVVGEYLADLILGRPPALDLSPFRVERFTADAASARVVVDHAPTALRQAGPVVAAIADGALAAGDLTELGAVLVGSATRRRDDQEIVYYNSVGVGVQDAAADWAVLEALD